MLRHSVEPATCRVLYLVQLPPPLHGVSAMNERVLGSAVINRGFKVRTLRTELASDVGDLNALSLGKLWRYIRLLARLLGTLLAFRPQLVYVTPVPSGVGFLRDSVMLLMLRLVPTRRVLHMHGLGIAAASRGPLMRWLYRRCFAGATVISLSERVLATEFEHLQDCGLRHIVIPNTLPSAWCAPIATAGCRSECSEETQKPLQLLYLSALFESKGVLRLPALAEKLRARELDFSLQISGAGTPRIRRQLVEEINARGLSQWVTLTPPLYGAEKRAAFEHADLLVLPTVKDYLPLVILEAMASRCAVLATAVGAIPDLVRDGQTGYLVAADDDEALLQRAAQLIERPRECLALGQAGRFRYLECFGGDRFDRAMRSVIAGSGA